MRRGIRIGASLVAVTMNAKLSQNDGKVLWGNPNIIFREQYQESVDPASFSVVRYTELRPFVLTANSSTGNLAHLKPPAKKRGRARRTSSDAVVGGATGTA